jgi:hypothetical protein
MTPRERLQQCLQRVPASVNNGSHQKAVLFKKWTGTASSALKSSATPDHKIAALVLRYDYF